MIEKLKNKKGIGKEELVEVNDLEAFVWNEESLVDELCDYVDLCYMDSVLEIIHDYTESKIKEELKNK